METLYEIGFERVDSTSALAQREIAAGHFGGPTLVHAVTQTQGTGRWSRPWTSPPGGLWMTLALPSPRKGFGERLRGLGLRLGVGMWEGVAAVLDADERERLGLKWPNDLVTPSRGTQQRRKLAGLLAETTFPSSTPDLMWVIVGVGVNVNSDPQLDPARSRNTPTGTGLEPASLKGVFGRTFDLGVLRQHVARRLWARAEESGLPTETYQAAVRVLVGLGEPAKFTLADESVVHGMLEGVDPVDGLAIVRTLDGRALRCAPQSINGPD